MKKALFIFALSLGSFAVASAQTTGATPASQGKPACCQSKATAGAKSCSESKSEASVANTHGQTVSSAATTKASCCADKKSGATAEACAHGKEAHGKATISPATREASTKKTVNEKSK